MQHFTLTIILFLFSIALIGCNSTQQKGASATQVCTDGNTRISTDFEGARIGHCVAMDDNEFLLTLLPESSPINDSAWYAFEVEADSPAAIRIVMKVKNYAHRYPPKKSQDMQTWSLQPYQLKGDKLVMNIQASNAPVTIAAQEVIDNQYYETWAEKLSMFGEVDVDVLGLSTQKRAIYKMESRAVDVNAVEKQEWLVVLGRQHPPEITGALALFPFTERLLGNEPLAEEFRKNYNILIIPNINPDGVALGNWRFNANNKDLNRDWIKFSEQETQLINNYLKGLVKKGDKIKFAVDFHSTHQDVFYTMPVNYGVEDKFFVKHWLKALDELMPNFDVVTKPGNTPNNGVSKQYFADNFNVHAITYEMGDNTGRDDIKRIAINAADTLMSAMLSEQDHNEK